MLVERQVLIPINSLLRTSNGGKSELLQSVPEPMVSIFHL